MIQWLTTHLAVVKRVFLGAGLYKKLVRKCSILSAVAIAVTGDPACLPIGIKRRLQTYVDHRNAN